MDGQQTTPNCDTLTAGALAQRIAAASAGPLAAGQQFDVTDAGGQRVANLAMDDAGNVLLCAPDRSACAVVGQGVGAAIAVEQTLSLLGLAVANS